MRDAITCALELQANPTLVRVLQTLPLPPDVDFLLRVATGCERSMAIAAARSGKTPERLESAASFYIEQVLLYQNADSYRVLGCTGGATQKELWRHMALMMRWLHPDLQSHRLPADAARSVFVNRVTQAWNNVKSEERRLAYRRQQTETAAVRPQQPRDPCSPLAARKQRFIGFQVVPCSRWRLYRLFGRLRGG